jgi:HD superfamily phosphohydrolase
MLIFDNVHGYIEISILAKQIIDTSEFQRLKNIHQTGALYYVFPTAVHTRFEHSIGTYYLTGVLLDKIKQNQPELGLTDKLIELVKLGGLCHDLGHCSYSHTFDDLVLKKLSFYKKLGPEKHHEYRSIILVKHIVNKYKIELSKKEVQIIQDIIYPINNKYDNWDKENQVGRFLLDIVCNTRNNIDVDKFDYISRDNLAIGLKLGFDYTRLLQLARVIDDTICYPKKIIEDIFHLFFVRYRLYKQIYNHKTVVSIEHMLADILIDFIEKTKLINETTLTDPNEIIQFTDHIYYLIRMNGYSTELFNRIDTRNLYTYVGQCQLPIKSKEINKIFTDILMCDNQVEDVPKLNENDFLIKDLKIGYVGGNNPNPLDNIYFYDTNNNNIKYKVNKYNISLVVSDDTYQERFIRFYCKNKEKLNLINELFIKVSEKINKLI